MLQKRIVDITDVINDLLQKEAKDMKMCFLFIKHTTAAITTADLHILNAFEAMIPRLVYRHPHNPLACSGSYYVITYCPSLAIPANNRNLDLGTWQWVVVIEFNRPRSRKVVFLLYGEIIAEGFLCSKKNY